MKVVVADLKVLSRRMTGEMRTPKNTQVRIVAVLVEYFNLQPIERVKVLQPDATQDVKRRAGDHIRCISSAVYPHYGPSPIHRMIYQK